MGINDPVEYQKKFLKDPYLCSALNEKSSDDCALFWVSTHARPHQKYHDEGEEQIQRYNEGMRSFFEQGGCGKHTGYIDVYNMTATLLRQYNADATYMASDTSHWGMVVNLVKFQLMMHELKFKLKLQHG